MKEKTEKCLEFFIKFSFGFIFFFSLCEQLSLNHKCIRLSSLSAAVTMATFILPNITTARERFCHMTAGGKLTFGK